MIISTDRARPASGAIIGSDGVILSNLSPEAAYGIATQIATAALRARLEGMSVSIGADCVATITPAADSSTAQIGDAAGVSSAPAAQPKSVALEVSIKKTSKNLSEWVSPDLAGKMLDRPFVYRDHWSRARKAGPGPIGSRHNEDVVTEVIKNIAGVA